MEQAHAVAAATMAQRKTRIAELIAYEVEACLADCHRPSVEKWLIQASRSLANRVVEIRRDRPTYAEREALMVMVGIGVGVDKIQLLTGGVTKRIGLQGDRKVEQEAAHVLKLVRGTG